MSKITLFSSPLSRLLFGFLILALFFFLFSSLPAQAQTTAVRVSPNNLNGWVLLQENPTAAGNGQFLAGPATAPLGEGSLRLNPVTSTFGESIVSGMPTTRFSNITSLTYHTYRVSGSNAQAIALQFSVCRSYFLGFCSGRSRLVYEPYWTGTNPSTGVWQEWDALAPNARWWMTNIAATATCGRDNPCTVATLLTTYPNLDILNEGGIVGVLLKAGSGWTGFDGYVDNLTIGLNGVETTYDFEPFYPVHNLTQDTYHPTIQLGVDNANVGDVLYVYPGSYSENVVIDKPLTLRGAGDGNNPANDTILDGSSLTGMGIRLLNNVTDVTIEDLRVANYGGVNPSAGIYGNGGNNRLTIQNVTTNGNGPGFVSASGGIVLNGPVDTVLIDNVTAHQNSGRGIVIWNGQKSNITITNNDVQFNNCCGIELQDGTAVGVTISNNLVANNADSGIAVVGLQAGAGPHLISDNTLTNNGRFGIEIRNPDGTGEATGDGSILVTGNNVSFTPSGSMDTRDHAGIAVYRRAVLAGNPDVPTGVVINQNIVSGYQQENPAATESEGFGIVIEGRSHTVQNNEITNSDVGIKEQGGAHPNGNYPGDAVQNDGQSANYFGRGNAPLACGNLITGNTFVPTAPDTLGGAALMSTNDEDFRRVLAPEFGLVENVQTERTFCLIQSAIDHPSTLDGHTLLIAPDTYQEQVVVDKEVTLLGPNAGSFGGGSRVAEVVIDGQTGTAVTITATNITLDGFHLLGDNGLVVEAGTGEHIVQNNLIQVNNQGVTLDDGSTVLLRGNEISAATLFSLADNTNLTAYANHLLAGTTAGLPGSAATLNARHNWWGTYATMPTGVDADSWQYRLGASITAWGVGTEGDASLVAAGGSGTGVIVNHGRGLANVPFGAGIAPYADEMCSDYYDFFVVNPSGNWTVSVPTDGTAACDNTRTSGALYQFALDGTAPDTACVGGACWQVPTGVALAGNNLAVTVAADVILQGTPFVAGDATPDSNKPTAVVLSSWQVTPSMVGVPLWVWFLLILGGFTAVVGRVLQD